MKKTKTKYICSNCGYESLRWIGKCPECDSWNSFTEEIIEENKRAPKPYKGKIQIQKIQDISAKETDRIITGIAEFDRVLGGGLMPGSVILLGGDPGIGKSTLAMQTTSKLNDKVLYVTGEESTKQIKIRSERLNLKSDNFYVLAETNLSVVLSAIKELQPAVVVIDSIQTIYREELDNSPGTVTQIRECTSILQDAAKRNNFCVIIVGHVTKDGMIAGPKIMEHIVDTVLYFEGNSNYSYRILRAQKNRYGSTNEIGIFEMRESGLEEIKDPSKIFLSERDKQTPGTVVTSTIEGTRPLLLETQALVTPSNFGYPQRVSTGFDQRRLSILLAVLEKHGKLKLSSHNVFINMAGGVKIFEPAIDLAVCCSIASSLSNKLIDNNTVVIGEVGLGGEVRSVSNIDKRIREAEKLGFEKVILPKSNLNGLKSKSIKIVGVRNVIETFSNIF
ncbi:MAG: DNA repair protein RadA [Bacteroidetes bacterium]|nr:DNA repair protein RadA [Bacteroidota bacterium]